MSTTRSAVNAIRARRGHKERSKNFTELEKRTVLELIARHRDVLRQGRSNNATNRSKQLDLPNARSKNYVINPLELIARHRDVLRQGRSINATNRSKQLVWSTICEEVNKRCGGERPRTPAQVKMWYENYKKKCKMRAHDSQPPQPDAPGLLDGMLWQNIHPLDVKDDDEAATSEQGAHSVKDDDCLPVNMTNGRLSSTNDSDDTTPNVLEPQVQIIPHSPSPKLPLPITIPLLNPIAMEQARLQQDFLLKLNELSNTPLNLSHLEGRNGDDRNKEEKQDCGNATEEERLYFSAKRQHAIWEHEAKMKILNMELKQKEEIFSLQKQLFLIELRLKMDFLEKASGK